MKFVNAHLVEYTPDRWLSFDDVLLMPQHSRINSRKDKSIDTSTKMSEGIKIHVPIISSPMDCVTEGDMANAMVAEGGAGIIHRFYQGKYGDDARSKWEADILSMIEKSGLPIFAIGASPDDIENVKWVLQHSKKAVVCVDVAHGHLQKSLDQVRRLKTTFGTAVEIISGSITTPEAAMHMIQVGCSALRVGVGSGSNCTTRIQTGFGLPLLTSIMLIRRVLHGMKSNVTLIADGGIRNSGDMVKALAAGADCVMLGRKLAIAQESSAKKVDLFNNITQPASHSFADVDYKGYVIEYRGQASSEFMTDHNKTHTTSEGISTSIHANNIIPVKNIIADLVGGLRSGMSYCGVTNLSDLYDKAVFIEQTYAGFVEGTPHGARESTI